MTNNLAEQSGYTLLERFPQDGSSRRYERYEKAGKTAILMIDEDGDRPDHQLQDWLRIGAWLREIGLRAPEVFEHTDTQILMEDFGDVSVKKAMLAGEDMGGLYNLAGQGLDFMQGQDCPLELPNYYDGIVHEWRDLIMQWYVPALRGEAFDPDLHAVYLKVWDEIEKSLPPPEMGFLHMDYHVENLMVLPGAEGLQKLGIIDFQGAVSGPLAYDLVNLCEDMRFDVPEDIQAELLKDKDEDFLLWYRVLGTQFHCRLVGQCVRWAVHDNKPGYMQYMPRLFAYLQKGLEHTVLAPLKHFFDEQGLNFDQVPDLDLEAAKQAQAQE